MSTPIEPMTADEKMREILDDGSPESKLSIKVWDTLTNGSYEERESLLGLIERLRGEEVRRSIVNVINQRHMTL